MAPLDNKTMAKMLKWFYFYMGVLVITVITIIIDIIIIFIVSFDILAFGNYE